MFPCYNNYSQQECQTYALKVTHVNWSPGQGRKLNQTLMTMEYLLMIVLTNALKVYVECLEVENVNVIAQCFMIHALQVAKLKYNYRG